MEKATHRTLKRILLFIASIFVLFLLVLTGKFTIEVGANSDDSQTTATPTTQETPESTHIDTQTTSPTTTQAPVTSGVVTDSPEEPTVNYTATIPCYASELMQDLGVKMAEMPDFYARLREVCIKVAYKECRGEPYEGQVAVIATILNRLKDDEFPNTPEEVVAGQYAPYSDVNWEMVEQCPLLEKAFNDAIRGADPTLPHLNWLGALYFYNPDGCSEEALAERENIKVSYRIGNHIFYAIWDI